MIVKRTTIELDQDLLLRAKRALGQRTTRGTVEEALRRASDDADRVAAERTEQQLHYLRRLDKRIERDVLRSEEMWR